MFNIQVNELPIIQSLIVFKNCDEDGNPDGFTDYNLTEANDVITNGNSTEFTITYYLSAAEAETGIGSIEPVPFNNATANMVYARVENDKECYRVSTLTLQVSTTSFSLGYLQELDNCDDDDVIDGSYEFDLTQVSPLFISEFPTGQNLTVHYYRNIEDAQLKANEILPQDSYLNETPFSQTLFVRVESADNGECFGIGPHLLLTVHPRPEFEVYQSDIFCNNSEPVTLVTSDPKGNYVYQWTDSSNMVVSTSPTATVNSGGTYTVIATSSFSCVSFPVSFTVEESLVADINNDNITIVELSDNNSIRINDNNLGIGNYEYALDDISGPYQDDPYFDNVGAGVHTIYIQDKNGCGISEIEVFIMGFPKYFTPNNDGYNDTWNVKGLSNEYSQRSTVYIYDRYGKLIKQINPRAQGWDGTFNGQNLKTSDYWFIVQLENVNGNATTYRGHFSLVR
jgi:gliding motility-associated-like protein